MYLRGKKVVLAISGGIAVYKVAELLRQLIKNDAQVRVIMTEAATEFVAPLTFETLSGNPVGTETFPKDKFSATHHIDLADWADLILIAPATANIIGKINAGIGDDLVTTTLLAAHCLVVIAPAMNTNMWNNPITKRNTSSLAELGMIIVPPESGDLACGYTGEGRLAPWEEIIQYCEYALAPKDFKNKKILISAGPTVEDIDDVRFISNRSSGKMGYALAYEAFCRGAEVTLVSGPVSLTPPTGLKLISCRSAEDMYKAVTVSHREADIFISAAAVADFTPAKKIKGKIKKSARGEFSIDLKMTKDILAEVAPNKNGKIHIGFALEAENGIENAKSKLKTKNLDAIILNSAVDKDAGFESDTNKVTIISSDKKKVEIPLLSKREIAGKIFDFIASIEKK